jgi:hypothetical protein
MEEFKVGDKILIFDAEAAGIHQYFQNKIVKITKILDKDLFEINANKFKHPTNKGNWTSGWVRIEGIRKPVPLDKVMF